MQELTTQSTFLAIDDAIFSSVEHLKLEMCQARRYPGNPVLRMGGRGAPDEQDPQSLRPLFSLVTRLFQWAMAQKAVRSGTLTNG